MTSWHGHRKDRDLPAAVQQVWQSKFQPPRGARSQVQSNVDLAVLSPTGKVVYWFDGFRRPHFGRRELLGQYTVRELTQAWDWLSPDVVSFRKHPLKIPDLIGSRGIRLFVMLGDDRLLAYQVPVVETVPLGTRDWAAFAWPDKERFVDADCFKKWLSQIYPPGVMERTNPRTKKVYQIESVEGKLSITPAGRSRRWRYALAQGQVRLSDEGPDAFSYNGKLEMVLTYPSDDSNLRALRGVYEGLYPRHNQNMGTTRWLRLQAAFESRPD